MLLPLALAFNVCLHLHLFPLCAVWQKSDSSAIGEPQGNWKWNSNSRDVQLQALLRFPAPLPECPGELACSQAGISMAYPTSCCQQALQYANQCVTHSDQSCFGKRVPNIRMTIIVWIRSSNFSYQISMKTMLAKLLVVAVTLRFL